MRFVDGPGGLRGPLGTSGGLGGGTHTYFSSTGRGKSPPRHRRRRRRRKCGDPRNDLFEDQHRINPLKTKGGEAKPSSRTPKEPARPQYREKHEIRSRRTVFSRTGAAETQPEDTKRKPILPSRGCLPKQRADATADAAGLQRSAHDPKERPCPVRRGKGDRPPPHHATPRGHSGSSGGF